MNIGILGAGSWAIALSVLLNKRGHTICMWEFNKDDARMLAQKREHPLKLPGIIIPENVTITNDITEPFASADYILCVVPAQIVRPTMKKIVKEVDPSALDAVKAWIIASKGIECSTLSLLSDVIIQEIPDVDYDKIVVLSGPSHAEEVSRGIPTTVVAASKNNDLAEEIQNHFSTETFRVYTNNDVIGVELCAGIKNIIAIAAGICDGLGFGDNTKGALLTRGMVEIARLGKKLGADEMTFSGLAGFGDLITTCISRHSRNRNLGELIASGISLEQALKRMTMVAEGVETTKSAYQLAKKYNIIMPITTEVYRTLYEGKPPLEAVKELMVRQFKPERIKENIERSV
jgi:glycerol-3-phosphate dehydrogenase (NAD(P)+)